MNEKKQSNIVRIISFVILEIFIISQLSITNIFSKVNENYKTNSYFYSEKVSKNYPSGKINPENNFKTGKTDLKKIKKIQYKEEKKSNTDNFKTIDITDNTKNTIHTKFIKKYFNNISDKKSAFVKPDTAVKIKYKNVILEIPAGAVKEDTKITIEDLYNVSKLNPGMNNVTVNKAGYRFLPSMKFEKPVKIIIPYNKDIIESDEELSSLYTYFYNEEKKEWEKLTRIKIDKEKGNITSITDHFTDMINSTLKLPESPKPLNFNPNSIKEIKAADPLTGIPDIEGLNANSFGSANFKLALKIPQGRKGMTPNVALSYNSGSGNGWLGSGFGITVPAITIDTKFGLPKYNQQDTYLLNGDELLFIEQEAEGRIYKTRSESFSKIIKKNNDTFEITSASGVKHIYGDADAKLNGGKGTYKWMLKRTTDTNGNFITYSYNISENHIYLKSIQYTGHSSTDSGNYRIDFVNENRDDRIVDCRGKFKAVLGKRLKYINIYYKSTLTRQYVLDYEYNSFHKSQIARFIENDADGNEFYAYQFNWNEMERENDGVKGFEETVKWNDSKGIDTLNRSHTISTGTGCYVGIGWFWNLSAGVNTGLQFDYGFSSMKFIDVNGDNLSDLVWKDMAGWKYKLNNGESGFDTEEKYLSGLNPLIENTLQVNFDFSIAGSVGPLSTSAGAAFSWSNSFDTFADVNGDGYIDYIPSSYASHYCKNNTDGVMENTGWQVENYDEPLPLNNGASDTEYADDFDSAYHLIDPVVKWIPNKSGKIKITGTAKKIEDQDNDKKGDGVKLNIYRDNETIWEAQMQNGDIDQSHEIIIDDFNKSENIYFKVNAVDNIDNDLVGWDPQITYEEIQFYEDMDLCANAYYQGQYSKEEFESIIAKCTEIDGNFLKDICFDDLTDDNDEIVAYRLNSLNEDNHYNFISIMLKIDHIIPKKMDITTFENLISNSIYHDDEEYVILTDDGERKYDKDWFFINDAYKKTINGEYYVLKKVLNGEDTEYNYNPGSSDDNSKLFGFLKGLSYEDKLKYYQRGDEFYQPKSKNGKLYIEELFSKSMSSRNILFNEDTLKIGDISEKGILSEIIDNGSGEIIKKWIKQDTEGIHLIIENSTEDIIKTAGISNDITVQKSGSRLVLIEKLQSKIEKEYILREMRMGDDNDKREIPLTIDAGVYLTLFEEALQTGITQTQLDQIEPVLIDEGYDAADIYDYDDTEELYFLKISTADEVKHLVLSLLDNEGFITSCYIKNENVYEIKQDYIEENLDPVLKAELEAEIFSFLQNSGLTLYTSIRKKIIKYIDSTYEVNTDTNGNYLLEEIFDNEGITVKIRTAVNNFQLSEDFSLTDLAGKYEPENSKTGFVIDEYYSRTREYFGGGINGWYYGEWNGNIDFDSSKIGVFNEDNNYTYYERMKSKTADYSVSYDLENGQGSGSEYTHEDSNVLQKDMWHGTECSYKERKFDENGDRVEEQKYFASYVSSNIFCPSRVGGDSKDKSNSTQFFTGGSSGSKPAVGNPGHIGFTFNWGLNASISFASYGLNSNIGESYNYSTLFDINGDRYPDKIEVTGSGISAKINEGGGFGAYKTLSGTRPFIRKERNANIGLNVSSGPSGSWMKPEMNSDGVIVGIKPDKSSSPAVGVSSSRNGNIGESKTLIDFIDINGDGLVDQVVRDNTDYFEVRLNTGDSFESDIWQSTSWDQPVLFSSVVNDVPTAGLGDPDCIRYANMVTAGDNLSIGIKNFGISGNVSLSGRRTKIDLIDINGDGLPDQILKTGKNNYFLVKYNYGDRFADNYEKWYTPSWKVDDNFDINNYFTSFITERISEVVSKSGGDPRLVADLAGALETMGSSLPFYEDINLKGPEDVISFTGSLSFGIGVNFTIQFGPWFPTFLSLYVTPNFNLSYSQGETNLMMTDINGDGLADHVLKSPIHDHFRVKVNNAGKVGLLKEIISPAGGRTVLTYDKMTNTPENPNEGYILKTVTKYSGVEFNDDGSEKSYTAAYDYQGGNYNRNEREFFGYSTVITSNPDTSYIINTYYNDSYYNKGILSATQNFDREGNLFSDTESIYEFELLGSAGGKNIVFTKLTRTIKTVYQTDTGEYIKTELAMTEYDDYGNVKRAIDKGNINDPDDDVYIAIEYEYNDFKYIMNKPAELKATEKLWTGKILRQKFGTYYPDGNLKTHETYCDNDTNPIITYEYDQFGNIKKVTNLENYSLNYIYDDENNTFITNTNDSLGYGSQIDYDFAMQNQIKSTDMNGNIMTNEYDSFGRPAKIFTDYDDNTPAVEFIYYHKEFPARAVTKNKIHFNSADSETLETVIMLDGLRRQHQSKKESETASSDLTETIHGMTVSGPVEYDELGRKTRHGAPLFQEGYNLEYVENTELKIPTETVYDAQGRVSTTILPDLNEITNEYDMVNGEYITTVTDPNGNKKTTYMDSKQNIIKIEQFNKGQIITNRYEYNVLNEITKVIDAGGYTTTIIYDTLGRRINIDNPDSGIIEYKYDINSNIIEKIDNNLRSRSQKIKYEYNNAGMLTKIDFPESQDIIYEYGTSDDTEYNQAGRLKYVSDASGIVQFYYGNLGEENRIVKTFNCLSDKQNRSYEISYQYDYLGRMESITYPGTHDRRNNITQPAETVFYEYNHGGQVNKVTGKYPDVDNELVYVENIMYDEYGQRVLIKYGNGVETRYTYDENRRWLNNLKTANNSGKTYQNIDYNFDAVGNILDITNNVENKVSQTFTYDDLYQLTDAAGSYENQLYNKTNNYQQHFQYDSIGNMTSKISRQWDQSNKGERELNYELTYTYDPVKPHQSSQISGTKYDYDANGNLVKKYIPAPEDNNDTNQITIVQDDENSSNEAMGWTWEDMQAEDTVIAEYKWDESNQMKQAITAEDTVNFIYSAGGDRAVKYVEEKSETLYVDKIYQLDVGLYKDCITKHIFIGETRLVSKISYEDLQNNAETEKRNTYYYHPDHIGSSNFITDRYGDEYEHIEYTPYGETWFEMGNDNTNEFINYKFSSKELDEETGLYYFGARYYDPKTSKWASCDPIFEQYLPINNQRSQLPGMGGVFNTLNLNLYHYAGNNPIKYVDPDGNETKKTMIINVNNNIGDGSDPDKNEEYADDFYIKEIIDNNNINENLEFVTVSNNDELDNLIKEINEGKYGDIDNIVFLGEHGGGLGIGDGYDTNELQGDIVAAFINSKLSNKDTKIFLLSCSQGDIAGFWADGLGVNIENIFAVRGLAKRTHIVDFISDMNNGMTVDKAWNNFKSSTIQSYRSTLKSGSSYIAVHKYNMPGYVLFTPEDVNTEMTFSE